MSSNVTDFNGRGDPMLERLSLDLQTVISEQRFAHLSAAAIIGVLDIIKMNIYHCLEEK